MSGIDPNQFIRNLDDEQLRALQEQIDDEEIERLIQQVVEKRVVPHLQDIRKQARETPPAREVREAYASMSVEEQEEAFDTAVDDVLDCALLLRESPNEGLKRLKSILRDPYTTEGLLLIFENEEHIDSEYSAQMKEYGATLLRYLGFMLGREMYEQQTRRQIAEELGVELYEAEPAD